MDTNWFTGAIHLCARKYCTKANCKILQYLILCARARAVPCDVTNFSKWEFHSAFISFTRAPLRRPTRDSIFRTVFRRVSMAHFPRANFFLISCLVSFVPRRNHAFVLRNHSIYLRAEKLGQEQLHIYSAYKIKNIQFIRRRKKVWRSKCKCSQKQGL